MAEIATPTRARRRSGKFPLRVVTLALLTGALIALSVVIAVPFLHAITWGVALAIIGWPMHKAIRVRVGNPTGAAVLSTLIVLLVIVVPGLLVARQVASEASQLGTTANELVTRDNLEALPGMDRTVAWMDSVNIDLETQFHKMIDYFLPDVRSIAQGSVTTAMQFLVAMYILFYAFRDRGEFMHGLRELLPLTRQESNQVFVSAADSVHGNLYATVVTSLIDSALFTLLFWFFELPAPLLWGAVMFVLSILPMVGAGLVWFPVGLYLAMQGSWPAATTILGCGIFTAVAIDYFLFAKIAGDRMRMHPVPAMIAFLGGLAIFGLSGMILGPAIVAMTDALLNLWRTRHDGAGSAMTDAK